jgi:hypothetical protein
LSAAFCNLDRHAQEDLTRRYEELCAHYGMTPSRNNPGIAHENWLDRERPRPSQTGAARRVAATRLTRQRLISVFHDYHASATIP